MGKRNSRRKRVEVAAAAHQSAPQGAGVLAVHARYDAASQGRRMAGWSAPSSGPNNATRGAQTIINRARDAGRNEWAGASS